MTILLLAGTAEARALAGLLAEAGIPALASLAGATARPEPLPLPTRTGGFGGAEGFRAVLREEGIRAVIDATHPFAARITERTAGICAAEGMPCLRLQRPGWQEGPGDDWRRIAAPDEARAAIPAGATVFLATGRQSLPAFEGLAGRKVLARVVDPPRGDMPVPGGQWITGRPPFTEESEVALFALLGVQWLVAKDAGGPGGWPKMAAARRLGLPVVLLDRPPLPAGLEVVGTARAALDWAKDWAKDWARDL
ncbi:cobalt-precorrin-6A reductase [Wenxinia saemankumensis]|uniref:Precorrin-6A/cobalt-precorrin-6A reductase n=1 Tax=Wenxinia saemankumensis TaxID=1447782 RepID=A0A1M5ZZN9_9RHOB|nr:cobalt-precorrin-6A reductase [Wenxinia saemankumensis]SHI29638.1 precorrin-6A/cobalt-precorrin-6A reductase [Wenxinia saemankumensis]